MCGNFVYMPQRALCLELAPTQELSLPSFFIPLLISFNIRELCMNIMRFSGPYLQCSAGQCDGCMCALRVESNKCNERAACIWKLCALTNNVILYMNMDLA